MWLLCRDFLNECTQHSNVPNAHLFPSPLCSILPGFSITSSQSPKPEAWDSVYWCSCIRSLIRSRPFCLSHVPWIYPLLPVLATTVQPSSFSPSSPLLPTMQNGSIFSYRNLSGNSALPQKDWSLSSLAFPSPHWTMEACYLSPMIQPPWPWHSPCHQFHGLEQTGLGSDCFRELLGVSISTCQSASWCPGFQEN